MHIFAVLCTVVWAHLLTGEILTTPVDGSKKDGFHASSPTLWFTWECEQVDGIDDIVVRGDVIGLRHLVYA